MKRFLYKILMFITIPFIGVVLIEIICIQLHVPKISYPNIFSKSQNLIPQINSNTILFLGDSRVEWGVKPMYIKKNINNDSDINVINLAMPGSNGADVLRYLRENGVYPKMIILGYTSNYGRYNNHGLDKINYSRINRIKASLTNYLKQNSYVFDYNSILIYLRGEHPLHIGHDYDKWGGVNVTEYGTYKYKKDIQTELYKAWSKSFEEEKFDAYRVSIKQFKKWFNDGGTSFYGVYMPISDELFKLEEIKHKKHDNFELFEKYYDYSNLKYFHNKSLPDSIYFYDGSHLSLDYAISFSELFAKKLEEAY